MYGHAVGVPSPSSRGVFLVPCDTSNLLGPGKCNPKAAGADAMTKTIILLYLQATKMSVVSHAVPSMPGAHCPDELSVRGAAGTGAWDFPFIVSKSMALLMLLSKFHGCHFISLLPPSTRDLDTTCRFAD